MYELRNALLRPIGFLVYNLTCFMSPVCEMHGKCAPAKIFAALFFFRWDGEMNENWHEFQVG